jgi:hypothetical protein
MTDSTPSSSSHKSKPVTFQTTVLQTGKNTTGIEVPPSVIDDLGGGKRPLVKVKVNDYTYRSAVAVMDGKFMISMSAEHRQAGGFQGGDKVVVTLELDLETRTVEIPEDLKNALVAGKAMEAFEKSAPSMKKEYVRWVEEAKAPETRERRIVKTVEKLKGI